MIRHDPALYVTSYPATGRYCSQHGDGHPLGTHAEALLILTWLDGTSIRVPLCARHLPRKMGDQRDG